MKTGSLSTWALVALLISHSGCGVNPETIEHLRAAVNTVSSDGDSAIGDGPTKEIATGIAKIRFEPSYPDRKDPFSFPAGEGTGKRASSPVATMSEVEVLGFAKVGQQHVLLRSGESSRSLRVGESIDGIRVVAINPPTVRLQMGTLVWTATMFDNEHVE